MCTVELGTKYTWSVILSQLFYSEITSCTVILNERLKFTELKLQTVNLLKLNGKLKQYSVKKFTFDVYLVVNGWWYLIAKTRQN